MNKLIAYYLLIDAKSHLALTRAEIVEGGVKRAWICYALNDAADAVQAPHYNRAIRASNQLQDLILGRLGAHVMVDSWLIKHGFVPSYDALTEDFWFNQVQAYRHRWLDSLIEEFKPPLKATKQS